jgi:FKBP-type peptidyl-prolyl cis-trans isomerase SlyD
MSTIQPKTVVSLTYQLRLDAADAELFEEANEEHPLVFLSGVGQMIEKFEKELAGKSVGDSFSFKVSNEEGYGPYDNDMVVNVPKQVFMIDGKIADDLLIPGNVVPLRDQEGNTMEGVVVEIQSEAVVMDFNHPLASSDLYFSGKILSVRPATAEELDHGHVHGPGGHHH